MHILLLIVSILGVGLGTAPERPGEADAPNVIVIHVDDLGWTDLSIQGSHYYETPHIDRLTSQGVRFTNAYAAAAICSPSRAALLTGRYPARIGITDWIRARFQGGDIPPSHENPTEFVSEPDKRLSVPPNPLWLEHEEVTLAELLEEAGYASAHIGKWHLGADPWYPKTQGFDVNVGGCDFGQPPSYFDPYCNENQGCIPTLDSRWRGEYLTDREADEAIAFIRENRERPFFLHLAHYAVHTPIQAKEDLVRHYEALPTTNQSDSEYAAMVHSVDQAVGAVMATLEALDLTEKTLLIFTSDNGGLEGPTDNAPLRSGKGYPYEGGIRVPFAIRMPGTIPAAQFSHVPIMGIDVLPTVLAAAGLDIPDNVDGLSLWDHAVNGSGIDRDALYWHFPHYRQGHTIPPYSIVRRGPWKLLKWWEGPTFELYNIADDLGETTNLAGERPDLVEDLNRELDVWLERTGAKLPRSNPDFAGASQ